MCTCYTDDAEFHSVTYPKARKPHRCYECDGVISAGSRYERQFLVVDGHPDVYETCVPCSDTAEFLIDAQVKACGCGGYLFGELWNEVAEFCREHLGYNPAEEAAK